MFTRAEKGYLTLTLAFLAAGSGIKAYRHASVKLGPFPDQAFGVSRLAAAEPDSLPSGALPPPDSSFRMPIDSAMAPDTIAGPASAGPAVNDPSKSAFAGKVDLNRADAALLTRVKGIGGKTAEAIIRYRQAHGPFRDLRDLLQVKGIGEKKREKLSPYLIL
jgi:competence ComEA-like helix-hairpin-helix protein